MAGWKQRLSELGIALPEVAAPVAAYVPALRTGSHVYTSGQLPLVDGKLQVTGKVGDQVTPEQAKEQARICGLNALAAVDSVVGLDSVARIVKRSEEHTSELQSRENLVCRLLLEKKK